MSQACDLPQMRAVRAAIAVVTSGKGVQSGLGTGHRLGSERLSLQCRDLDEPPGPLPISSCLFTTRYGYHRFHAVPPSRLCRVTRTASAPRPPPQTHAVVSEFSPLVGGHADEQWSVGSWDRRGTFASTSFLHWFYSTSCAGGSILGMSPPHSTSATVRPGTLTLELFSRLDIAAQRA